MQGKLNAAIKENLHKLKENGAIHIVVGSFLTKFVSFFGSILIVRFLTKSEYGILSYYENFVGYFTVLAGIGLSSGLLRYVILADGISRQKGCFSYSLLLGTLCNVALVIICAVICLFYPHPEAFANYFNVAICLVLCIPFVFILNAALSVLRATFQNKTYATLALVTSAVLIIGRIVGAVIGGMTMTVAMRLFAEILCGTFCVIFVYKKIFNGVKQTKLDKPFKKELISYSAQLMIIESLWMIFMLNDVFLLGQLLGNETVLADYKVAYVIPANLSLLSSSIAVFVAPYFTKYAKDNNYDEIKKKLWFLLVVTMAIMGAAVVVCEIFAQPLIILLYSEEYLSAVPIMRVLLLASFFNNGIRLTIANVLAAIGKQKVNLITAIVGMVAQIVLDLWLIPYYGSIGVAFISIGVYLLMCIILSIYIIKNIYTKKNKNEGESANEVEND